MKMSNGLKLARDILSWIAGAGASIIVGTIVNQNVDTSDMKRGKRWAVAIGSGALGMMVGDAVSKYTADGFDGAFDIVNSAFAMLDGSKNEEDESDGGCENE